MTYYFTRVTAEFTGIVYDASGRRHAMPWARLYFLGAAVTSGIATSACKTPPCRADESKSQLSGLATIRLLRRLARAYFISARQRDF